MGTLLLLIIVWAVAYSIGKGKSADGIVQKTRTQISDDIVRQANEATNQDAAAALRVAAARVRGEWNVIDSTAHVLTSSEQKTDQHKAQPASAEPLWVTEQSDKLTASAQSHTAAQDNASMLLYFGAFLLITGVGLFVGLSDFSGTVKVLAVSVLALTFYASGLYLYQAVERLRPAGTGFTAIGLITMPLVGVAVNAFLFPDSGNVVWLVTSLFCMVFYTTALYYIRQSFVGYLAVFMGISLWLSAFSVVEAPLYIFAWAMMVLAMSYMIAAKYLKLWQEVQEPLAQSAQIIVPTTLVLMLLQFGDIELLQQGITVLLAAAFYGIACWLETAKPDTRRMYFGITYALPLIATALLAYHASDEVLVSAVSVSVASIAALGLAYWVTPQWRSLALTIGGLGLSGASLIALTTGEWTETSWLLALALAVHMAVAFIYKNQLHFLLGSIHLLTLPAIAGVFALNPQLEQYTMAWVYIGVAASLLTASQLLKQSFTGFKEISLVAFGVAIVVSWMFGLGAHNFEPMTITIVASALVLGCAYLEKRADVAVVALVGGGIALVQGLYANDTWTVQSFSAAVAVLASVYYAVGKIHHYAFGSASAYARMGSAWVGCGLTGLYIAALTPIIFGEAETAESLLNALLLIGTGALTAYEGFQNRNRLATYIGGGVTMFGLQWIMYINNVEETQFYTHLWAAYFAALAWYSAYKQRPDDQRTFTVLALGILTVPLALQALGGDTGYGLWLLLESVGLVLLGLLLKQNIISRWGLVTAVGSVLYQLRDYQFFVLALLGLGIITISVVMLLRRTNKN